MSSQFHDPRFDGAWQILQAHNPYGQAYTGRMVISPAGEHGHHVEWYTSAGNYTALALAHEGELLLGFGRVEDGFGMVVYEPAEYGLKGLFTAPSFKGKLGMEKVSGASLDALEGTWDMEGFPPMEGTYKGKVAFSKYGNVILLRWAFEGSTQTFVGVGVPHNQRLVVAYGLQQVLTFGCGIYSLQPDGKMQGRWASPHPPELQTETYVREGDGMPSAAAQG